DAAAAEVDRLLAAGYANWHVDTVTERTQLRFTKKGRALLHQAPAAPATATAPAAASAPTAPSAPAAAKAPAAPDRAHDRQKARRLEESDELFVALGLSDERGQLKPSRVAKYRQVERFLAALEPMVAAAAPAGRPMRVVDLGCGNAYLTFAAHRYLSLRGLDVQTVGVDVSVSARGRNTAVVDRLGLAGRLRFVDATIAGVELGQRPDLVLALHACDTATDDALARAVRWQAPVILAAPCCHHDLQRQLRAATVPPAYRLVTRHGILRERLADLLTDALRAAVLRLVGYRVEVIEFVDSAHTPRNAMIRAVRTGMPPGPDVHAAYQELVRAWQVRPALADRLADLLTDQPRQAGQVPVDQAGTVAGG
ncbi:MAG TPA: SAM-dependent methyltransferase, partial [Dermatophilaceae bacterium]|nr:SAM-dependent methyltransferase [Dermatophilaceae bacterium]